MPLLRVPPADPAEVVAERDIFDGIVTDIGDTIREILEAFNELVEKHNGSWGWFRRTIFARRRYQDQQEAIEKIRRDLFEGNEEGGTQFTEAAGGEGTIIDVATKIANHHTPVLSLFLTSANWVSETRSPTSQLYNEIWQPEDGRNLASWQGEARSAYDDIVDQQRSSVDAAADLASFMSSWLADIATDNVEYVTFLLNSLASILGKIIEAIGLVVNSVAAASIWAVAGVIADFVQEAISHLGVIANNIASMVERVIRADDALLDYSYFPNGNWPEAVTRA